MAKRARIDPPLQVKQTFEVRVVLMDGRAFTEQWTSEQTTLVGLIERCIKFASEGYVRDVLPLDGRKGVRHFFGPHRIAHVELTDGE